MLNTFRQVGGALGIAVMGAILTSRETNALAAGASPPEAFVDGFQTALLVAAAIAFVGAVTAAVLVRQVAHPEVGRDRGGRGVTATKRVRLAAPERRAAVLDCALREFSEGSYRGTTTASIARVAGVTEPILYRHFTSKRALFLACLDESWARVRELWERAVAEEPEPAHWVRAMALAYRDAAGLRNVISSLWIQALAEASEDQEIGAYMQPAPAASVHAFVADVYRRAQAAGGVAEGRVPGGRGVDLPRDRPPSCCRRSPRRPGRRVLPGNRRVAPGLAHRGERTGPVRRLITLSAPREAAPFLETATTRRGGSAAQPRLRVIRRHGFRTSTWRPG